MTRFPEQCAKVLSPKNKNPRLQHDTGNGFSYIPLRYNQQHLVHFLSPWHRGWGDCEPHLCPKRDLTCQLSVVIRYVGLIVRIYGTLVSNLFCDSMSNPWPLPWRKQDSTTSQSNFTAFITDAHTQFKALPPLVVVLTTFTLGSATAMSAAMIYKRFGRRIRNVDWVTPTLLNRKRWIKGVVTRSGIIPCHWPSDFLIWTNNLKRRGRR